MSKLKTLLIGWCKFFDFGFCLNKISSKKLEILEQTNTEALESDWNAVESDFMTIIAEAEMEKYQKK